MSSKHTLVLTDVQCMAVCSALGEWIKHKDRHPNDKWIAGEIMVQIDKMISTDKNQEEQKNVRPENS